MLPAPSGRPGERGASPAAPLHGFFGGEPALTPWLGPAMAQTISSAGGRDEKRTDGNQEKRTTKRDETHAHKVAMKRTKRRGGGAERGVAKEGEEERTPYTQCRLSRLSRSAEPPPPPPPE